ncbi:MAG: rRNA (guanosine2251-2-O)-methyltransferase [Patescibacteria group bacterium]|nr:rRNA (guanosine2251-2-O)-methyltransferase [Patescibacteria group bacterium]
MKTSLLLSDIRSLHNVGALFRTADCAGFDRIYLTGITATPPRPEISKTALGAENFVPWEYREDVLSLLDELSARGVKIIGLELSDRSVDYRTFIPEADAEYCLILGNEIDGVSAEVLAKCDTVLEIPMRGKKKSLNVSMTGGILMFRFAEYRFPMP